MKLEYLNWDSNFFRLKTGRIISNIYLSESTLNQLLEQAKNDKYKLVYVFTPESVKLSPEILVTKNGKLVDRKVIYKIDMKEETIQIDDAIRDWSGKPLTNDILQLSYLSGQRSRFLTDKKLPSGTFQRMYKEWIEKSLSGRLADKVFVAIENEQIVGFSTLKTNMDTAGKIGLIAVSEKMQGKKYGTKLINQCAVFLKERSINKLTVPTQMDNITACKFYERYGFTKETTTNIYHFWL